MLFGAKLFSMHFENHSLLEGGGDGAPEGRPPAKGTRTVLSGRGACPGPLNWAPPHREPAPQP